MGDGTRRAVQRTLSRAEIDEILARNHVGRIAFSFRDRVDIEPIHYVFADDWIWGRTSPGTKILTVQRNYWVAFEVDEIDDLFTWRSVVVHGGFYILQEGETEPEIWETAITLARRILPEALTPEDPFPHRSILFRVAVQEAEGRASTLEG